MSETTNQSAPAPAPATAPEPQSNTPPSDFSDYKNIFTYDEISKYLSTIPLTNALNKLSIGTVGKVLQSNGTTLVYGDVDGGTYA